MATVCTITVEPLPDGRHRATCTVFPDLEAVANTEEDARRDLEEAIGRHLTEPTYSTPPHPGMS